eukprot:CAMPEP_0202688862 /NCGR_PEP_ID=MMETSP1385-20130828/4263_1 /ASSEMBLY_ACC=CAM_ASM_000861 /TAXON_ID=933848 /ORGANISM="Elphidium margaritaceum" /LENGTH=205 /DNA_ID=CAMNT_0049343913 /DNA_START=35 /DNA_END=652 /DNA_ORIENTATION=+
MGAALELSKRFNKACNPIYQCYDEHTETTNPGKSMVDRDRAHNKVNKPSTTVSNSDKQTTTDVSDSDIVRLQPTTDLKSMASLSWTEAEHSEPDLRTTLTLGTYDSWCESNDDIDDNEEEEEQRKDEHDMSKELTNLRQRLDGRVNAANAQCMRSDIDDDIYEMQSHTNELSTRLKNKSDDSSSSPGQRNVLHSNNHNNINKNVA